MHAGQGLPAAKVRAHGTSLLLASYCWAIGRRRFEMQNRLFVKLGLAALVAVSPIAIMAQTMPPPPSDPMAPAEPMPPVEPMGPTDQMPPAQPMPPAPGEPMPPPPGNGPALMPQPMPAPEPMSAPSAAPVMTPPARPQPTAATEPYPVCTKTLQDSCRNAGEGPKAARKKRR